MAKNIIDQLKILISCPDLASKKWIYQQYDSQVMNDTISICDDAAIVRVHGTNKALALTSDCTPRYVEADPFEGAKQAVVETYRNISAVGAMPMAITNCLNFGNPQKPKIMGQIVKAINGINEACKTLNYPVVSGNVSLYNETDGKAIKPTPTIGGVGLLKDLNKKTGLKFKNIGDSVYLIGKCLGHINCSLYQREVLKEPFVNDPPKVDLFIERKNAQVIRGLIENGILTSCHDLSDGGLLVALFEMCSKEIGLDFDLKNLTAKYDQLKVEHLLFGEDQARYVLTINPDDEEQLLLELNQKDIDFVKIGKTNQSKLTIDNYEIDTAKLIDLNQSALESKIGLS